MGIRTRRTGRQGRRPEFDVRRTAFGFAFLALVVCGAGLAVRAALGSAERHPLVAGASVAALVAAVVVLLRLRRSRRVAARTAAAAVESAYEAVDAVLEELPEADALPPRPEPVRTAGHGGADPRGDEAIGPYDFEGADPRGDEAIGPYDFEGMDPYGFEEAVAALCRRDGCLDAEVVGGAGDLGADVVGTTPDGRRLVVQCKRYTRDNKVGSQDLQRFGGTCYAVHGAEAAVVVTTGEFTDPALEYAERCGIVCIGLDGLTAWSEGAAPPWYASASVQAAEG
ncbi:restriction endonuclease [Streptomyces sp. NBC_00059]|uniref:restriction endonuclease n=1 Tax=Streptomyces sp. NBC_00059 TaxID=2975635 RepID=UPI002258FAF0|nr:restriction endonuclease [Streptomyces sp. NBC_00059]MCX5415155.1 restriction endonuclease [Streptomyces sp. NBC_00059]